MQTCECTGSIPISCSSVQYCTNGIAILHYEPLEALIDRYANLQHNVFSTMIMELPTIVPGIHIVGGKLFHLSHQVTLAVS